MQDALSVSGHPVRLPQIVPIVLREVARFRNEGHLTQSDFEQKLARLAAEELVPHGLELLVRDLADGATRFLIKDSRTGRICEMVDCEGKPAAAADETRPAETATDHMAPAPVLLIGWEACG
jgi:hypothetical protein